MTSSNQLDTTTILLLILGAIILLPMLTMGMGFGGMMGYGGMMGGGMMGGYGGYGVSPLWGLGMMLVWVVVLAGGAYLVYRLVTTTRGVGTDQALEELRVEYARGNISEEEFETRRENLQRD